MTKDGTSPEFERELQELAAKSAHMYTPRVVTTLWCGYCAAPFNTEHRAVCKEVSK